ncbi:MAG: glycosyltransferase family 39 protein [Victivallales bacterium]|nr:glycosyltransferase family 39 protein [Victivallales bacterium]
MTENKSRKPDSGKRSSVTGQDEKPRRRRFFLILSGIVLIALILRVGTAFELAAANGGRNAVMSPSPATDMGTYLRLGKLIAGGDFQDSFYLNNIHKYQPFYNSVFLPLVFRLSGGSVRAVLIIQSLIGAFTVYLAALSAARIWNRRAAVLAALLTAFSQILILYTPYLLVAALQAFWLILLFYLTLIALKSGRKRHWALCALVCACTILSRGNAWFLVPGIMALAIYSLAVKAHKTASWIRKTGYGFLTGLVFLLLVILPQVPFAWRNSVLLGRFCGPSSDAPAVLSLGNTPESPPGGREAEWGAGPMEYPPSYHCWTAKDSPVSVPVRIWRWFRAEPAAFIELNLRKLLLFWNYREIPNNVSLDFALRQSRWLRYGFLGTVLILVPALAGIFILPWPSLRKKDLKILLLLYFILAYCAATAVFYILTRFRAPLIPLLAVLAAIFVNKVWCTVERRDRKRLSLYLLALCGSLFICVPAYDIYRFYGEAAVMRKIRPDGIRVSLGQGEMMYLDNGPRTFGGWQPQPLVPRMNYVKKINTGNIPGNAVAEFELSLLFDAPGAADFQVNGKSERVTAGHAGLVTPKFAVALPGAGIVSFKMLSADCNVFLIVDKQRNYGRSAVNGEALPGEIVCRLFIPDNSSSAAGSR